MSRVLFAFTGGVGHLNPMLPLAHALDERDHIVGVTGRASAIVDRSPFGEHVFPEGTSIREDRTTGTLTRPDLDHELRVIGRHFVERAGSQTAQRVRAVIDQWRPDLLVVDEMDFGSMVAAEAAGLPVVVMGVIASGALTRKEHVGPPLAELRRAHGLPPDPELRRISGDLLMWPFPVSLRDPDFPLTTSAVVVRPEEPQPRATHPAADWLAEVRPAVYVTLGTIFNAESGDVFDRLLAGVGDLPGRVLVTVGPDIEPDGFGAPPAHLRIERYVPQSAVLAACDVVVNHGGSGSVVGALAHGLPLAVIPMGADQVLNAQRVEALGAGIVLDPMTLTPAQVRHAVEELSPPDGPYRRAAEEIRGEILQLPTTASVVARLESLLR